jgi:hypothetical protein
VERLGTWLCVASAAGMLRFVETSVRIFHLLNIFVREALVHQFGHCDVIF